MSAKKVSLSYQPQAINQDHVFSFERYSAALGGAREKT